MKRNTTAISARAHVVDVTPWTVASSECSKKVDILQECWDGVARLGNVQFGWETSVTLGQIPQKRKGKSSQQHISNVSKVESMQT